MGTFVEAACVLEHKGQKFEAGGAWWNDNRIVAYVGKKVGDGMGVDKYSPNSRNYVTDWHGNKIGWCAVKFKQYGFGGTALYSVHGQLGSRFFYGVGTGEGMVFKGKFTKK
jgi:hypothetical protein